MPRLPACCGPSYSPALQKPGICARILLPSDYPLQPPFAGAGHEPASSLGLLPLFPSPLRGVTQRHCRALIHSVRMKLAWPETVDQGWGFAFSGKLRPCVENDRIILATTTRQCRQRLPIPARVPVRAPPPRVTEPTSPAGSPASRSRLPPSRCWRSTRSCRPAAPWCSCRRGTRRRRRGPRRYTGPG